MVASVLVAAELELVVVGATGAEEDEEDEVDEVDDGAGT